MSSKTTNTVARGGQRDQDPSDSSEESQLRGLPIAKIDQDSEDEELDDELEDEQSTTSRDVSDLDKSSSTFHTLTISGSGANNNSSTTDNLNNSNNNNNSKSSKKSESKASRKARPVAKYKDHKRYKADLTLRKENSQSPNDTSELYIIGDGRACTLTKTGTVPVRYVRIRQYYKCIPIDIANLLISIILLSSYSI